MSAAAENRPALRILTGCTAVGKTEWALRWAEAHRAEIVSCDSLLFYRTLDIGTAKPTAEERARVQHHLIDVCNIAEQMDITRYIALARDALGQIVAKGKTPLVVGGSGFYLKAFFAPVADDVAVPPEVRTEVRALPLAAALTRLQELNPGGLGALDVANPRRVSRALERCLASGRTLAELAERFRQMPCAFAEWQPQLVQLDRAPEELAMRITIRVEQMLGAGLIEEVRRARADGLEANPSAARAIGYREVVAYLEGRLAREDLAAEIAKNTRALVKKQRTWFRTQLPSHRVLPVTNGSDPGELFAV